MLWVWAPYFLSHFLPLFFSEFFVDNLGVHSRYSFVLRKQAYVKENEKHVAAENRKQFQPWSQNFKRFQESFESLQRNSQTPAEGSDVLCWTAFRSKCPFAIIVLQAVAVNFYFKVLWFVIKNKFLLLFHCQYFSTLVISLISLPYYNTLIQAVV